MSQRPEDTDSSASIGVHRRLNCRFGMNPSTSTYRAPRWLPGGHLQTLYPSLFLLRPKIGYRRERWDTPDGDFIDLDWMEQQDSGYRDQDSVKTTPLVVLFHGLEGNSNSHYA